MLPLTWRDVFDADKLNELVTHPDFDACRAWAKTSCYKYMAFNGYIYSVDETDPANYIGHISNL